MAAKRRSTGQARAEGGRPSHPPARLSLSVMDETGMDLDGRPGFKAALKKLTVFLAGKKGGVLKDVRIAFLPPVAMRRLKKKFFGKDQATDVLSFPDDSGGDIAVCPKIAWQDAVQDGRDSGEYLAEVILHGVLHLKGLEHDYEPKTLTALWKKQGRLLAASKVSTRIFRSNPAA